MNKVLRLLLIEDSQSDAMLVIRELTRHGYKPVYELVDSAESMRAALDKGEWDIVISDYVLPGFSGLDALRLLNQNNQNIPCIIISGQIDDETAVSAIKAGAKDYVMKDNLKRLGSVVERELSETQARQEHQKAEESLRQNQIWIERQKSLSNAILQLFWEVSSKNYYLEKALDLIYDWSKCDCAGIRIVDEDNKTIPYVVFRGFSDEFIRQECILSLKQDQCACTRVILNSPEPHDRQAMTVTGSFCLFNSTDFIKKLSPEQIATFRGACIKQGFQTIVVVPIHHNRFMLGALHLVARKVSALSPGDIEILESVSKILGQGIYRFDMEEKIRMSENRLAEAQNIAHLGSWDWHIPGNKIYWSDEVYRIFGLVPQESEFINYDSFLAYVHHDDRAKVKQAVIDALEKNIPYNLEHRIILKDGTTRYVHEQAQVIFDGEGKPVRMFGTVQDISAPRQAAEKLRQSEEELRALSRRLVEVQENERRTIARELHDEIGQSLTALKMLLAQAGHSATGDQQNSLNEAKTVVSDLMQQVRELSLKLRPSMLDDLGLLPTLLWHFERFTNQTGIRINFNHFGLQTAQNRLSPEINTTVYRITQEALTNIARYSGVNSADITLRLDDDILFLSIEDKGHGFSVSRLDANTSTGLSGMRERVHLLKGRIIIDSAPEKGTSILVEIPVPVK